MPTIDSDAHVVESERTWDYMDPADQKYRPILIRPQGETTAEYWMIDGKIRGIARQVITSQRFTELSRTAGRRMDTPQDTRDMEDVPARLSHMDELGVDVQVLYPSIFIEQVADKAEWEVPICRGFNRWMADIWSQSPDRLRWICAPPLLSIPDTIDEMRYSKEHGAVGVFMRGLEGDRLIHDPYFYPLYEEASRLNMVIAVHIGNANPYINGALNQRNGSGTFWRLRLMSVGAFHSIMVTGLMDKFPQLHMTFAEASASWVPYVLNDLRRRFAGQGREMPENPLAQQRIWVACETTDDLPYILQQAGDDNIVIGTDYGHNDQSTEIEALSNLQNLGTISSASYRKLTWDNPKALFGL